LNNSPDKFGGIERANAGISRIILRIKKLKTFDSLKNPLFRLFFYAMACHWICMNIQNVTRSLLVYRLTGSGTILGIIALANAIPMLLFSLMGGAIADRLSKKNILISGLVFSSIVSLGVAVALTSGYLSAENSGSWWLLIASAFFQGLIMGLMMPSTMAIIPELVDEDQIMNGTALNNMGMNVFRLVGPAMTGVLIDAVGFDFVYYLATGVYFIGFVFLLFLRPTKRTSMPVETSGTLTQIKEGWGYVKREKTILLILVISLLCTIFGMPLSLLLPMFTEDILKVGATGMGFLLSVSGFGALSISLVIASLPNRKRGLLMLFGGLIMSLALVGFSFSTWWYLSIVLIAFFGLGNMAQQSLSMTLLQYYAEPDYRGRVLSFHLMGFGVMSLGTFFAGIMAEGIGVQWSIGGMAIILVAICVVVLLVVPSLRNLE
jgi:MFS family permease